MNEENKEPAFDYIIRDIKEPENWDKMESVIDDHVEDVLEKNMQGSFNIIIVIYFIRLIRLLMLMKTT